MSVSGGVCRSGWPEGTLALLLQRLPCAPAGDPSCEAGRGLDWEAHAAVQGRGGGTGQARFKGALKQEHLLETSLHLDD